MLGLCAPFSNQERTDDTVSQVQDRGAQRRELLPEMFRARGATEAARPVATLRRLALRPTGPSQSAFQRLSTHRICGPGGRPAQAGQVARRYPGEPATAIRDAAEATRQGPCGRCEHRLCL